MTHKKLSIADVDRLIRLYDLNRVMDINNTQKRSILSTILTQIGFYGQLNNVNAVAQAIKAVQREQDIQELKEEFDEDELDEDGILDANKYRNKQHQLRKPEQDQQKKKYQKAQETVHQQFLDKLHNVPETYIDILFETNYEKNSDYIRTHVQYRYHQIEQDSNFVAAESNEDIDVIILSDAQNQEKFDRIKNLALSRYYRETVTLTQYFDIVSLLEDIDNLQDKVFKQEKAFVLKLAMDLGMIIVRVDGNVESKKISYKYVLPIDTNSERRIPLEIRSTDSINQYKQYIRTVVGTMQEWNNQDTHEKIIAILSTTFFVFRFPLGGTAIPLLEQHIKRREIYYVDYQVNLCFWTAYSFITMPKTKDKRCKDLSRIAKEKRIFQRVNGFEFRDSYQGIKFLSDIDNFINKEQSNVHMYKYHSDPSHQELTQNYTIEGSDKQFNILFINDGINAHIMYISDIEAIIGFRYYNICNRQAFRKGDKNLQVQMRSHMKKCQKNNGKIVKMVILKRFAKPFVPHILSNKTYQYLLANNLTHLFKHNQYYITCEIETLEKKVNEKFGDCSQVIATLVPYAIASTVKSVSGIHSFYFDIRTENFIEKWLEQVFEEAKQVKKDNKYKHETIPQYFEVPVIGFNSAKFDTSLVFKNLKSKEQTISQYLCSSTIAKQIVVKHKKFGVWLKFVDFKIYTTHTRLKDCVRDFGNGLYKKGHFPHEFVNVNNYMEDLNKSEPFPREAFDNKLRNKQLSEDKYKEYLVEAFKFKTRCDYLQYHNIFDTQTLIELIDFLINLTFRYKIDMLNRSIEITCAIGNRKLKVISNKTLRKTIGEYMYNHLVEYNLPKDIDERKLTNLVDTNNEHSIEQRCTQLNLIQIVRHQRQQVIQEIIYMDLMLQLKIMNSIIKKGFFFRDNGQRKILGVFIEKQGYNCIALYPKKLLNQRRDCFEGSYFGSKPIDKRTNIRGQYYKRNCNYCGKHNISTEDRCYEQQYVSQIKVDDIQIGGQNISDWYDIYLTEAQQYNAPKKEANSILRVSQQTQDSEQDDQLSLFQFRSKIKQYERINKEKITIPTLIKDVKVKPLSKLQRPYFSPKIGSCEIDVIFGSNPSTRRTRFYLFEININTKYLMVILIKDKSSEQLKIVLRKLIKQVYVNNIRGDGETGFKANIINKNEQSLQVDLEKYTSQKEAERVAIEQRQRAQQPYRIQRQEFRSSANDLQLILIQRLQKTVVTNIYDLFQISDIIDLYNQPNNQ
ncbi:MAG: hypothetical protein EZS28_011081 [Streblomastix strix]|uniref:Integrase catalytic domain-containing protein n=1 Tax=Streblomastix strix TaxID=222440 RepID=A0A5J4WFJ1_9EUKA|nr:MAG: hypothetical protein EZS28_011081 [Streblomastix strix]